MKSPTRSNTLYTIELARGMACLVILALHAILFGQDRYHLNFPDSAAYSKFLMGGVDLFFIISGFLMVHTTRDNASRNAKDFLLKRFIRIYPAYWLVLLTLLPVFFFKPEWAFFGQGEKPSLLLSFLLLPQQTPPILSVAWTLVFEIYFYLIFAATLFLNPIKQLLALTIFFMGCVFTGLFFETDHYLFRFITSDSLLEFLAGMLLASLWPFFPKLKIMIPVFLFLLFGWLVLHAEHGPTRFINLGIPAILLFIVLLFIEKTHLTISKRFAVFIGGISYALYLVHVPIIAGLPKLLPLAGIELTPVFALSLAIFLSLVGGVILHYGFEIPVQKMLHQHFNLKSKIPLKA